MGITFRHDVAAGLAGSFAAGQAEGRRRRQKYVFDALSRRQDRQFQLERDILRRQEARNLLGQRGAQARDLLAERGRQDARLLERRGMQARELALELEDARQEGRDRLGELRLEQERIRGEFDIDQEFAEGIRRGELRLPEGTEEEIARLDAAEQNLDRMGKDSPEARQRIQERRRQLLRSARPPAVPDLTPIERARQSTILWDPDARDYVSREEAGPNSFPVPLTEEGLPDWRNAQTPDPNAAQKRMDDQFKAREALIKAKMEQARAGGPDVEMSAEEKQALQDMVDLRQDQLDSLSGGQAGAPAAPTAPAAPAVQPPVDPFSPEATDQLFTPASPEAETTPVQQATPEVASPAEQQRAERAAAFQQEKVDRAAARQQGKADRAAEAAFAKAWKSLAPGQVLRGPDGKLYMKRK